MKPPLKEVPAPVPEAPPANKKGAKQAPKATAKPALVAKKGGKSNHAYIPPTEIWGRGFIQERQE